MNKEQLNQGNEIQKQINNLDSVLYYANIYKQNDDLNFFSFTYFDEVGNKREIKLPATHNEALIIGVKNQIKNLNKQFENL